MVLVLLLRLSSNKATKYSIIWMVQNLTTVLPIQIFSAIQSNDRKNSCIYYSKHVKLCVVKNKPLVFQSYTFCCSIAIRCTPFLSLTIYIQQTAIADIFIILYCSRAGSRQNFCRGTNEILGLWAIWSLSEKAITDNWSINEYGCVNIKIRISYNFHDTKYSFDYTGIAQSEYMFFEFKNQIALLNDYTNLLSTNECVALFL